MKRLSSSAAAVAALLAAGHARAQANSYAVTTEAVNDYSACNGPSLSNRIANADGFLDGMLSGGPMHPVFTPGLHYTDSKVWATDFRDPDVGSVQDDDTNNFDRSGDAISYYSGHGVCITGDTLQLCYGASDCSSPPGGTSLPAMCRAMPGDSYGTCSYTSMTRQMAVGDCTDGNPSLNGRVNYSSGKVKWGESPFSTGWAGAGINGGINLAVVDASCAMMSGREREVWPVFAGVHMVAFTTVHSGDTADVSDRGSAFSARYQANPLGSVGRAWVDALNAVSNRNSWCSNAEKTQSFGGGFGYNGCGLNEMVSMDVDISVAEWHTDSETWQDVQNDELDSTGRSHWWGHWTCNWDCKTYPVSI
jgi:hypothetical protein